MLYPSDKKLDKNQKFNPPKKFQALSSNDLVKLKNWIYNIVTAGQGIRIERSNDRVIVHAETAGKGFGGMGGYNVGIVTALPAIPTSGMKEVYWTSGGGGTGDNQVWRAYAGQSVWYPTQKFTSKSGTP